jgi:hypothetical protein
MGTCHETIFELQITCSKALQKNNELTTQPNLLQLGKEVLELEQVLASKSRTQHMSEPSLELKLAGTMGSPSEVQMVLVWALRTEFRRVMGLVRRFSQYSQLGPCSSSLSCSSWFALSLLGFHTDL